MLCGNYMGKQECNRQQRAQGQGPGARLLRAAQGTPRPPVPPSPLPAGEKAMPLPPQLPPSQLLRENQQPT